MLLAIESSCDETAVSVIDLDAYGRPDASVTEKLRTELISSQVELHRPYGGVVPELAAREHIRNLPILYSEALEKAEIQLQDLSAVAVTQGPGLKGCLLVGVSFAKALCWGARIPLIPVNHLEGHLFACHIEQDVPYPCLTLLVSGGHTVLVLCRCRGDYQVVAKTRDDASGEAFDKIATVLGLPYPGGPALSKQALGGDPKRYRLPIGMPEADEWFSFSGLKTATLRLVEDLGDTIRDEQVLSDVAASAEHTIVESLLLKTERALEAHRPKSLLLTGGVAANRVLRERLEALCRGAGLMFLVPPHRWCTDNATMIGAVAAEQYSANRRSFRRWREDPDPKTLGPNCPLDLGAVPRWPVSELSGWQVDSPRG